MEQTSAYIARTYQFIQKTDAFMDMTEMRMQNQEAALKSLENQVAQISQMLDTRPMGGFPSDTKVAKGPTHEQCKAISTRSGKILNTPTKSKQGKDTATNPNATTVPDNPAKAEASVEAGQDQEIPPKTKKVGPTTIITLIKLPRSDTLEDMRLPPQHSHKGLKSRNKSTNSRNSLIS
ncbi:hypothetical protein GQ457_08G033780 [Hibiscus cannabinus]